MRHLFLTLALWPRLIALPAPSAEPPKAPLADKAGPEAPPSPHLRSPGKSWASSGRAMGEATDPLPQDAPT